MKITRRIFAVAAVAISVWAAAYAAPPDTSERTRAEADLERALPESLKVQRRASGRLNRAQELAVAQSLTEEAAQSPTALAEARERIERVLESDARNVQALMLAGRVALLENKPAIAALHYRSAAAVKPVNAGALLGLGQSLEAAGDRAGADAAYAEYRTALGLKSLPPETPARPATAPPVEKKK